MDSYSRGAKLLDAVGIKLLRSVDADDKNIWKIAPLVSEPSDVENKNKNSCEGAIEFEQETLHVETLENKSFEKTSDVQLQTAVIMEIENILVEEVEGIKDLHTSKKENSIENPIFSLVNENTPFEEDEGAGFSDDSIADPNYEDDTNTSSSSDENVPIGVLKEKNVEEEPEPKKKSRKRKRMPENWKRNQAKTLRNSGKPYKTLNKGQQIAAREIKPPCGEHCRFKCATKFSMEEREQLFSKYWGLSNIEKQRAFISTLMQEVMKTETSLNKKRTNNNAFYFLKNNHKIRVCKIFFVSTLGVTSRCIRSVISGRREGSFEEKRGRHAKQKNKSGAKIDIRAHIESIPKIESHYTRAHSEKQYIEGGKTITDLYRDYKNLCLAENKQFASLSTYRDVFNYEYNLAFFVPKKDQCQKCVAFENADEEEKKAMEIDYLSHQHEKKLSRAEKQADKDKISESYKVACFDLEATLPIPKGDVSTFYYKSKLSMYNFTVCDLASKGQGSVYCFMWHEGQGKRGPNEIGSCLLKYLQRKSEEYEGNNLEIVFYSDNCSGQQKNKFVLAAYFYALANYSKIKSITHKYLVSGHTQNEGDNVHSLIEKNIKRSLRSGPISTPDQYVTLVQTARKTGEPFKVVEMSYDDFFDIKNLTLQTSFNFTKDSLNDTVKFSEACVFKVERDNLDQFYYKTSFGQSEYRAVSIKPRKNLRTNNTASLNFRNIKLECAYKAPLEIPKRKYEDLIELLRTNAIKKCHAHFYNSLKPCKE